MPRIRKKTTNRQTFTQRAKIQKNAKDSKRKQAKKAKKNPQWKSKTPKDPGIPNEFPFKDQILGEIAEQRRIAAEDKQRKKDEKKLRAAGPSTPKEAEDVSMDVDGSGDEEEQVADAEPTGKQRLDVGAENIASLTAKVLKNSIKKRPQVSEAVDVEEEEEVPILINRDLPNMQSVIDKADVVIEVLDARDPLEFRSAHLESIVQKAGKKLLFVLSKIDTCPRESLAAWAASLRSEQPTLLFRSATAFLPTSPSSLTPTQAKGKKAAARAVADALGTQSILDCLSHWSKEKKTEGPLNVAVVGLCNSGKSSLINSLLKRAAIPIYSLASSSQGPTTTTLPQEVMLEVGDQSIQLIDTPGLSFVREEDVDDATKQSNRAHDIVLRAKGRIERLKDPNPPIDYIVSRANTEDLMLLYSLPAFSKGDPTAFLSGVARANQLVKKHGALDLVGAAKIVLRDWSVGKFSRYTTPSLSQTQTQPQVVPETLYAGDESILSSVLTRKELRKSRAVVRFTPGVLDTRNVAVEEPWQVEEESDEEDSDEDGDEVQAEFDEEDDEDEDEDEEVDDDEAEEEVEEEVEEEEVEEVVIPVSKKQKRKRTQDQPTTGRPGKKVAFAAAAAAPSAKASKKPTAPPTKATVKPVVSVLKKSAPVVAKPSKSAAPSKKKASSQSASKDGEAYDFGKFF